MKSILLDKTIHDRQQFDCGIGILNQYLQNKASQQAVKDNARTFVITDDMHAERIIGFYTLTMTTLDLSALPEKLQKKHASATSAGLIARLAVDQNHQKQKLGEWLLLDALYRLLAASETVAFPLVMVDAKDGARSFYQQYGFQAFQQHPDKLFITMSDIRANLL